MANSIDLSQFHEIFFEESYEGLESMEAGLLKLDRGSTEPEVVNTVFRAAHSIKGSAGTFGFSQISDYTHVVETLLDEVRANTREVTKDFIDVMLTSVDFMRQMIDNTKAGKEIEESQVEAKIKVLQEFASSGVLEHQSTPAPVANTSTTKDADQSEDTSLQDSTTSSTTSSTSTGESNAKVTKTDITGDSATASLDRKWLVAFKPNIEMMLTGNDPFRFLRELSTLGVCKVSVNTRNLPDWEIFDPEYCYLSWEIELVADVDRSVILEIFEWIVDDCELNVDLISGETKRQRELAIEIERQPEPVNKVSTPYIAQESARSGGEAIDDRNQEATSIRVNIDKVDNLVNLVGELVITQSILHQFTLEEGEVDAEKLQDGLVQLERNTRELQEETMRIRMLPIDSVFQRLPRLIRDLSGSLGKKVELKMRGNQTEVDKTVLEKIGDPLMHLIRNAMDHGLETPDERIRKGKPETGLVDVNAYHEGGNIIIEVMDDGAGLNRDKILEKARKRGTIKSEEDVSDAQLYRMILMPGFTTADQLSDVSGRGVGLDVVNKNISDLGGSVDVSSVSGAGSIFTIKLPLTLAIVDSQLVRVGNETLIIPLLSIIKSLQIEDKHHGDIAGETPVYRFEDEYIPVIHLDKSFNIHIEEEDKERILVVVDVGQKVGLLANEVVGLQQVVIKTLESNFKQIEGIAGATILGDGKVAMIVDIGGLIRLEEARSYELLAEHS